MNKEKDFEVQVVAVIADLETRVREVTLLNDQTVYPYQSAQISLRLITPRDVKVTSYYVLEKNLLFIRNLHRKLLQQGYDILQLTQGLIIQINKEDPREIVPPVVEVENNVPFILDGLHRAFVADAIKSPLHVIQIKDVSVDAYALPNVWSEIQIRQCVPDNPFEKKRYREGYRDLYRNLPGTSGIRMKSN
jgi:hypothetical protein